MAVAKTGNTYTDTENQGSGGGEYSITPITVPADADIAIAIGGGYSALRFDQLNWDGDNGVNDFTQIDQVEAVGHEGVSVYRMLSNDGDWPGSGDDKTLWWSLNNNATYGGCYCCLFFLSGVDLADPVGTIDVEEDETNNWQSANLGTGADDMAIIAAANYGAAVDSTPGVLGQTEIWDSNNGDCYWGIGYEVGETTPEVGVTANYFGGVAFAINAAAAGGVAPTGTIYGPLVGPLGGPI